MDDKLLETLRKIEAPAPSDSARDRALEAALAAFDAGQQQKSSRTVQGLRLAERLRSIALLWKRTLTMDIRIPLGASMAAILVLPMGWYFLNQTALTPPSLSLPAPVVFEEEMARAEPVAPEAMDVAVAPAPVSPYRTELPSQQVYAPMTAQSEYTIGAPPSGLANRQATGDSFASFEEGGTKLVSSEPVSTFSVDVDTASYAYVRRMLDMGQVPPADAIRVEELINYFSYDYAVPAPGGDPFVPTIAVHPTPWNTESRLLHIGVKAQALELSEVPPANLVLLIDTSGSMDTPDRLPLLKRAFGLLINELGPDDTVSIVTYAGSAGVALEPTRGSEKAKILAALDQLSPGGSTAGAAGIEAAYRLAEQAMIAGGTNRVLLATDGDFNVGISDPRALEDFITQKRESGIFLSVLGFGMGNYNDATMQALAQAGNGNAAYIDSYSEARKVLVEELGGTLVTIASDVKVQVEFNPAVISEYRLVGYETRALNREDFNNDAVDAGEVGAGHSVTAIYEIVPVGARGSVDPLRYGDATPVDTGDELGFVKIRYKAPGETTSQLIETPIGAELTFDRLADAPDDMQFATAVAAFGQKLRGSGHLRTMSWDEIRALAVSGRSADETGRRAEFIRLIDIAASLS